MTKNKEKKFKDEKDFYAMKNSQDFQGMKKSQDFPKAKFNTNQQKLETNTVFEISEDEDSNSPMEVEKDTLGQMEIMQYKKINHNKNLDAAVKTEKNFEIVSNVTLEKSVLANSEDTTTRADQLKQTEIGIYKNRKYTKNRSNKKFRKITNENTLEVEINAKIEKNEIPATGENTTDTVLQDLNSPVDGSQTPLTPQDKAVCYVCGKEKNSYAQVGQHMAHSHFSKELRPIVKLNRGADRSCNICKSKFKSDTAQFVHISTKHGFLNDVLRDKGFPKLQYKNQQRKIKIDRSPPIQFFGTCELCQKDFNSTSVLTQHMVRTHFNGEVRERFVDLVSDDRCTLCDKALPPNTAGHYQAWVLHVGAKHNKVETIMLERGLKPISQIFHPKVKLKKESLEERLRDSMEVDTGIEHATLVSGEEAIIPRLKDVKEKVGEADLKLFRTMDSYWKSKAKDILDL